MPVDLSSDGFRVQGLEKPIDNRYVIDNVPPIKPQDLNEINDILNKEVDNHYPGIIVYVSRWDSHYRKLKDTWVELVSKTSIASTTNLGVVKIGTGLDIKNDGLLSLKTASTLSIGGIKVKDNSPLTVSNDGTLTINLGDGFEIGSDGKVNNKTSNKKISNYGTYSFLTVEQDILNPGIALDDTKFGYITYSSLGITYNFINVSDVLVQTISETPTTNPNKAVNYGFLKDKLDNIGNSITDIYTQIDNITIPDEITVEAGIDKKYHGINYTNATEISYIFSTSDKVIPNSEGKYYKNIVPTGKQVYNYINEKYVKVNNTYGKFGTTKNITNTDNYVPTANAVYSYNTSSVNAIKNNDTHYPLVGQAVRNLRTTSIYSIINNNEDYYLTGKSVRDLRTTSSDNILNKNEDYYLTGKSVFNLLNEWDKVSYVQIEDNDASKYFTTYSNYSNFKPSMFASFLDPNNPFIWIDYNINKKFTKDKVYINFNDSTIMNKFYPNKIYIMCWNNMKPPKTNSGLTIYVKDGLLQLVNAGTNDDKFHRNIRDTNLSLSFYMIFKLRMNNWKTSTYLDRIFVNNFNTETIDDASSMSTYFG